MQNDLVVLSVGGIGYAGLSYVIRQSYTHLVLGFVCSVRVRVSDILPLVLLGAQRVRCHRMGQGWRLWGGRAEEEGGGEVQTGGIF